MALNATFDPILSRVRMTGTLLDGATTAVFERSKNNLYWTTVRGGSAVSINGSDVATLDDYEFTANQVNYYRVTAGSDVFTTTITPNQAGVWLKSITRPFLNRAVEVTQVSDITLPARAITYDVIGRSLPIARSDVRLSRQWDMQLLTESVVDADALELVFASGDALFIQTDGTQDIPGGYVSVGDVTRSRFGYSSDKRRFDMELTEVAPPGPDVVGATSTWQTLVAEFGSWNAVLAAFGTWAEVLEYVADPQVVFVP